MLVGALLLSACATDGITGGKPTVAGPGGHVEDDRVELVNAADPTQRADILPSGARGTLTVSRAGAFMFTIVLPNGDSATESGTLSLSGDTLTYNDEGDELLYLLTLESGTMTWRALETELYDLNGDGVPEETYLEVVFVRE